MLYRPRGLLTSVASFEVKFVDNSVASASGLSLYMTKYLRVLAARTPSGPAIRRISERDSHCVSEALAARANQKTIGYNHWNVDMSFS